MKKNRIALCGARLKRYFIYFAVCWVLMIAYTMGAWDLSALIMFFVFLAIAVVGLLIAGVFTFADEQKNQVAKETVEPDPEASGEALRKSYKKHMDRELRRDALGFLLLAAFVALWVLVLKVSGAPELPLIIGWYGLTVVPLVLSLFLLIRSLLPHRKETFPAALEDFIRDRRYQQALSERLKRPDLRSFGTIPCYMDQAGTPTVGSACESLKPLVARTWIGIVKTVFLVFGCVLTLLFCILAEASWQKGWLFLLIFGSVEFAFAFYFRRRRMTKPPMFRFPIKAGTIRGIQKKGALAEDRVLSAIPGVDDGITLEICFDKAGTLQCRCNLRDYRKLLEPRDRTAYLLTLGQSVHGVFFAEEDETGVDSPADTPVPLTWGPPGPAELPPLEENLVRIIEAGAYPSDEQIREAALRRLETTDPAKIKVWEDEKNAIRELRQIRAMNGSSAAESERLSMLHQNILVRSRGQDEFRDLRELDQELREEGVKREEVAARKNLRVPFRAFLPLIAAVAALAVGIIAVRLVEQNTGTELKWAYILLSSVSGVLALQFATVLLNTGTVRRNFRKLKNAYGNPRFWSAMIEVETYNAFSRQWEDAHK